MVLMPVVKEDPSLPDSKASEGHLIAAAIAAYRNNNLVRAKSGLEPLSTMVIPCILMRKTQPIFYLVPVGEELSLSVLGGSLPKTFTRFSKCRVGNSLSATFVGIKSPEYRKQYLQSLVAFNTLAKDHWEKFAFSQSRKKRAQP